MTPAVAGSGSGVFPVHDPGQRSRQSGVLFGQIAGFADILGQVVELHRVLGMANEVSANRFPVALHHGLGAAVFVEFPVQVRVEDLSRRPAEQSRGQGDPVEALRRRGPGQFRHCRQHVLKSGNQPALDSGSEFPGPAGDQGDPDAAFVEIAFHASERAIGVEVIHLVPAFAMGPVVAGEEDRRPFVQVQFLEQPDDFPYVLVQYLDHAREALFLVRPIPVGELSPIGDPHAVVGDASFPAAFVVRMRQVGSVVQEKGLVAVFPDELQGFFENDLRRVIDRDFGDPAARFA